MNLKEFIKQDRFAASADIELLEYSDGYAKARMEVADKHLNAADLCQGGAIFTLADLALAAAMNASGKLTLTTSSQINFVKAERKGAILIAEAREIVGQKLVVFEVKVTNDNGDLIAIMTANGYRKDQHLF